MPGWWHAETASALGQWASVVVALIGFVFVWLQIRAAKAQILDARRAADAAALVTFLQRSSEREVRFNNAPDKRRVQAFVELLNHLECYAAIVNNELVPEVTTDLVIAGIADSIVSIERASGWHQKFEEAVTSKTTFREIGRFLNIHRPLLDAKRATWPCESSAQSA